MNGLRETQAGFRRIGNCRILWTKVTWWGLLPRWSIGAPQGARIELHGLWTLKGCGYEMSLSGGFYEPRTVHARGCFQFYGVWKQIRRLCNGLNGTVVWILRAQDSTCSWLLSHLRSLKANKKTLYWMKWYCRVDFTSPGQYMLVVAFNFKESESK